MDHVWLKRASNNTSQWEQGNDLGHLSGELNPAEDEGDTQNHPLVCPGDRLLFAHTQSSFASLNESYSNGVVDDFLDGLAPSDILGLFHRYYSDDDYYYYHYYYDYSPGRTYLHLVDLIGYHNRTSGQFSSPGLFEEFGDYRKYYRDYRNEGFAVAVRRRYGGRSDPDFRPDDFERLTSVPSPGALTPVTKVDSQFQCLTGAKLYFELIRWPTQEESGKTLGPMFVIRNDGEESASTDRVSLGVSLEGRHKFEEVAPLTSISTFTDEERDTGYIPPNGGRAIVGGVDRFGRIVVGDEFVPASAAGLRLPVLQDRNLYMSNHNTLFGGPDDVWGLFYQSIEMDSYGQLGVIPDGGGWSVGGVSSAGSGYTLVRQSYKDPLNWTVAQTTYSATKQSTSGFLEFLAGYFGTSVQNITSCVRVFITHADDSFGRYAISADFGGRPVVLQGGSHRKAEERAQERAQERHRLFAGHERPPGQPAW